MSDFRPKDTDKQMSERPQAANPDPVLAPSLPDFLSRNAKSFPSQCALRQKHRGIWKSWTWAEADGLVTVIAGRLAALGWQPGMRVIVIGRPQARLFLSMAALQRAGLVPVPLFADAGAQEIRDALAETGARLAIAGGQEQVGRLLDVQADTGGIDRIVYLDRRGIGSRGDEILMGYERLVAAGPGRDGAGWIMPHQRPDDTAMILHTRGTTGKARGVILSHAAIIHPLSAFVAAEAHRPGEDVFAFSCLGWMGGALFGYAGWLIGASCLSLPESANSLFEDQREAAPAYVAYPPHIFRNIAAEIEERIMDAPASWRRLFRHFVGVALRRAQCERAGRPVSPALRLQSWFGEALVYAPLRSRLGFNTVKAAYVVGGALEDRHLQFFNALGVPLRETYAQVEAGGWLATRAGNAPGPGFASQGRLKLGADGEVHYATDIGATSSKGWASSGDIGVVTADGLLNILGRKSAQAPSDEKPWPEGPESAVLSSPLIAHAARLDAAAMVVSPDARGIRLWAKRNLHSFSNLADFIRQPVFADGLRRELASGPEFDPALRWLIVRTRPFDPSNGELSWTGELRRHVVEARHRPLLDRLAQAGLSAAQMFALDGCGDCLLLDLRAEARS